MGGSDTIFALSSGALPAGIAVVRMSGSRVRFGLETLSGRLPEPRKLSLTAFHTPDGALLDQGMAAFFPAPASATGEDMAELHLHGSRAVVVAVSRCLATLPGIRAAEPGEFTRRAFLNGKLDLVQVEALGDLINAETEAQRRFALANASGVQSALYGTWHERLLHARAMIEAELDFSDEGDVPGSVSDQIWADMAAMVRELNAHVEGYHRAEIIRDGFLVVVIGPPNAGKSSLLNALAQRDVAIVSDEPGTTRDLIEVALDLNGVKVRLVDTAGIRDDAASAVEHMGMERALERASEADLVLLLRETQVARPIVMRGGSPAIRIATKADLWPGPVGDADLQISTVTGAGMSQLLDLLATRAAEALGSGQELLPSRERHIGYLRNCLLHLERAVTMSDQGLEERAELLREAAANLGRITGAVGVEDLLDSIFANFCIGK